MNVPSSSNPSERVAVKYRIHWHVMLTHFPISAFLGAFLFMGLHLLTRNSCFALAAYVSLVAGAAVMLPATATGWLEWKSRYKRVKGELFRNKIRISLGMTVLSIVLALYQTTYPFASLDVWHSLGHLLYFASVSLLMLGAVAEGYLGGRLHHR